MHPDLASLIDEAETVAVLTGAGISTESGIPDFRSPGGIWSQFRIIEYREFMASAEARLEDWRRRFHMEDQLGVVKPNRGHELVAALVASGKCPAVITQNIDGLHQEAGVPDDKVIEVHGTARHASCTFCGTRHTIAECRQMLEETGKSPACRECGSIVKSDVVMFGEAMPERAFAKAIAAAENCALFLTMGTSLAVHPAASLPVYALKSGARLVIVNREQTDLDDYATLVLNGEIGELVG
ncbi:MAG: Sir2 family NAD-dependent protein deacetylase [Pseudomonadota bacterium]|nr:Sir2 family NAD-dependent protein deacetylase [Pseudomonadota bacterium]